MVKKVNADLKGVGRNSGLLWVGKQKVSIYKNIASLKNKAAVSVTSTQGKLEILRRYYEGLGKVSVDENFEAAWKEEIVHWRLSNLSEVSENDRLVQCVKNLIIIRLGVYSGGSYFSSGMVCLLEQLLSVIWFEELVPQQWREGLIVSLFKKGDKEAPGKYRGVTLLSVVDRVFCILNNRLVECLDIRHEGQGK